MARVVLEQVVKRYGQTQVVHGMDLEIEHNEFVVLVGPSGCGKSTILRMIAGLEEVNDGAIRIGARVVNDLAPRDRNVSMVFQNYALYPHMNVRENLGFSLKIARLPAAEISRRVAEAADILGLGDYLERTPAQLSGGQRQRVAMGRAIVRQPDVFLFDEPLSNLDAKLRVQMRTEIKRLHQRVATTVVYVTHDQVEAMTLADRVVILRDGHIVQAGAPLELFEAPVNTFVAGFIGSPPINLIDADLVGRDGGVALRLPDGTELVIPQAVAARAGTVSALTIGIRPDYVVPEGHGLTGAEAGLTFERAVTFDEPLGAESLLFTELGGQELLSKMYRPRPVTRGETMRFHVDPAHIQLFERASGLALALGGGG